MDKLGVQIQDKLRWGKRLAFTQPKTQADPLEFLGRSRMKMSQRLPLLSLYPIEGGADDDQVDGDNDDKEEWHLLQQLHRTPYQRKGPNESDVAVQEQSLVVPQFEEGTYRPIYKLCSSS